MVLNILTDPNPILRTPGREVTAADLSDKNFKIFVNDLKETMRGRDGVGIAAPQVGQSIKVCIIAKEYAGDNMDDLILVNPVWEKKSIKRFWGEEGCLSVPEIFGKVKRYKKISISAMNLSGKPIKIEAEDFFARIVQHEIDHLNGILFIDKAKDLYREDKKL
ncbi:MAG: peptide deformylase [Candidatus Magasanikbacteria bacterium]|nr:peptide deformylase [Candidatus Magasanikbacteria bacterium]